ncbi:hypothetical protein [Paraburkholderia sp. GAS42]|uniref:hypothetical protein n=1 Tax=Paraburkholderia sp. GAS42 TaxID=3035135 RepID=UPI003D21E0A9
MHESDYFSYAMILLPILVIPYLVFRFQEEQPGVAQTILYFFFLACCATPLVTEGAIAVKAIGENGEPLTSLGHFLRDALLPAIFDIESDIFILMGIAVLIVFPQLLTYVVCGISGCASAPIWISGSIDLLFWGIAKSFAVAGGVLISFSLFCIAKKWNLFLDIVPHDRELDNLPDLIRSFGFGFIFLLSALILLWIRLIGREIPFPRLLVRFTNRVHTWATRYNPTVDE